MLAPVETAAPAVAQPWSGARGPRRWASRRSGGGGGRGREGTRAAGGAAGRGRGRGRGEGGAQESLPPLAAAIGGGLGAGADSAIGAGAARHGGLAVGDVAPRSELTY